MPERQRDKVKSKAAVFLGPTLGRESAQSLLPATYYRPAAQGDVYRVLASGIDTIVLIDGTFHGTRAVWQRELLVAMHEGITVIGASSMGALRAAELHSLGMIGCGTVFRWYRDGVIDGDDEVAQLHGPEEVQFRPISEPLVNIRFTLKRAVKERVLSMPEASKLVNFARSLYFPNRSYPALLNSALVRTWNDSKLRRFVKFLEHKKVDIKRRDAILALKLCAKQKKRSQKKNFQVAADQWEIDRCVNTGFYTGSTVITGDAILREVWRNSALVESIRKKTIHRHVLLLWTRSRNIVCPKNYRDAWIHADKQRKISIPFTSWLRVNGLSQALYEAIAEEHALVDWILKQRPPSFGLDRSFAMDWARQCGIPVRAGHKRDATLQWIVKKGLAYFGQRWNFSVALLRELQFSGKAGDIARRLANP